MANKRIPDLPPLGRNPAAGDLVHVWDGVTGKSTKADVSTLPGSGGGGGSDTVTTVASPFFVFAGSSNYSYDADANSVKITDERLLNKTNYPVFLAQFNGEADPLTQLTYNPVDDDDDTKGSVVIANFQLDDGAHLTITVPGQYDPSGDTVYAQLLADVAALKLIAAPFMPTVTGANGAKVWWTGGAIPAGWQECIAMRGVVPLAQDSTSDNADLNGALGGTGGAAQVTLDVAHLPAHSHFTTVDQTLETAGHPSSVGRVISNIRSFIKYYLKTTGGPGGTPGTETYEFAGSDADNVQPTLAPTSNTGGGTAVNILNPYLRGMWIEYAGI